MYSFYKNASFLLSQELKIIISAKENVKIFKKKIINKLGYKINLNNLYIDIEECL